MTEELKKIKDGLGSMILKWEEHNPRRIYVSIDRKDVKDAAKLLFEDLKLRFSISTGIDTPEGYELMHHFSIDPAGIFVTLRIVIPKSDPKIESITPLIPGAEFIERELYDMLGITFLNHPRPERLLLPDDWPDNVFPLRKDN